MCNRISTFSEKLQWRFVTISWHGRNSPPHFWRHLNIDAHSPYESGNHFVVPGA